MLGLFVFFFFSSRRRHTRFDCDWSSDVCSSDLLDVVGLDTLAKVAQGLYQTGEKDESRDLFQLPGYISQMVEKNWIGDKSKRSEERRVGKECRSRWWTDK